MCRLTAPFTHTARERVPYTSEQAYTPPPHPRVIVANRPPVSHNIALPRDVSRSQLQSDMTEEERTALGQAVVRNANWLALLMDHPQREELDLYLPIAGVLRVMLCDAERPILLAFAEDQKVPLRVWGPRPARKPMHPALLFSFNALICSWDQVGDAYEMSIEDFLDTPLAVASIATPDGQGAGSPYTPRQVIKWAANKEGVAHFDLDKPATLENLSATTYSRGDVTTRAIELRRVIYGRTR